MYIEGMSIQTPVHVNVVYAFQLMPLVVLELPVLCLGIPLRQYRAGWKLSCALNLKDGSGIRRRASWGNVRSVEWRI